MIVSKLIARKALMPERKEKKKKKPIDESFNINRRFKTFMSVKN